MMLEWEGRYVEFDVSALSILYALIGYVDIRVFYLSLCVMMEGLCVCVCVLFCPLVRCINHKLSAIIVQ